MSPTRLFLRLASAKTVVQAWLVLVMILGTTWHASANPVGIMVPAYFYPGPLWTAMNAAAAKVPLTAIMNPDSGPGTAPDANYTSAVNALRGAGGKVIAYIHTSYAARPLAQVELEVDQYLAWYALDGFFVDEMTNDAVTGNLDYYTSLAQYIKGRGAALSITGNPGSNTQEAYLTRPTADNLMIFENGTGYPGFTPASWVTSHLARQFTHVVYNIASATTMMSDINLAVTRNAGWVYVTDDSGANPYDTLPAYWNSEVNYVQSLNQSRPATQLKVTGFTSGIPSFQVSGAPGTYEIQATVNLRDWVSLQVVNAPGGSATCSDGSAGSFARRFYRAAQ